MRRTQATARPPADPPPRPYGGTGPVRARGGPGAGR
ncbi:hypothetical protein STEPF1_02582 [Streptomyces sp. F-1]|nr:hypothetical protein STEPF1_02582 [Streptomyces sp. F-1]